MESMKRLVRAAISLLIACASVLAFCCDDAISLLIEKLAADRPILMVYLGETRLYPESLVEFSETAPGARSTVDLRIANIGRSALRVSGASIGGSGMDSFQVVGGTSFPMDLEAATERACSLAFEPLEARVYSGVLVLSTNDPDYPTITLDLSGVGAGEWSGEKPLPGLSNFSDMVKSYGDPMFSINPPSSNSIGQITYTSGNAAVATISGTTVTVQGAGTSVITAHQAETANYAAGTISATLTVNTIAPTLGAFAGMAKNFGDAAFTPVAPTSNSSGSWSYSSGTTSVATASGTTITIVGVGTSTITATQAAAGNYNAATATATLTVSAVAPTVTSSAISSIHSSYATGGGNVTSGGGVTVTSRGVCWSTLQNPTTGSSSVASGTGTGSYTASMTGLAVGTTYYVRAWATNSVGTSYGAQVSFQAIYAVGDSYAGGIVVSISGTYPNQHGLAFLDVNLGNAYWSNGLTGVNPGATSTTDGAANTAAIVACQGTSGTYAAKMCDDRTDGGYTDWYLPARDQLVTIYNARAWLTNFTDGNYWSSTQWAANDYYYANEFNYPGFSGRFWTATNRVRAVRTF